MSITLQTGKGDVYPTEPGQYVLYRRTGFPKLHFWSEQSKDWRDGYMRVNDAIGWIGPLPHRKEPKL